MRGLLPAACLLAPALAKPVAETNDDAIPSAFISLHLPPRDISQAWDLTFRFDVSESQSACGIANVTINDQTLGQSASGTGQGSFTSDQGNIIIANWNFTCVEWNGTPQEQFLSLGIDYVDGLAFEDVGFVLRFQQTAPVWISDIEGSASMTRVHRGAQPGHEFNDEQGPNLESELEELEFLKFQLYELEQAIFLKEQRLAEAFGFGDRKGGRIRFYECDSLKCLLKTAYRRVHAAATFLYSDVLGRPGHRNNGHEGLYFQHPHPHRPPPPPHHRNHTHPNGTFPHPPPWAPPPGNHKPPFHPPPFCKCPPLPPHHGGLSPPHGPFHPPHDGHNHDGPEHPPPHHGMPPPPPPPPHHGMPPPPPPPPHHGMPPPPPPPPHHGMLPPAPPAPPVPPAPPAPHGLPHDGDRFPPLHPPIDGDESPTLPLDMPPPGHHYGGPGAGHRPPKHGFHGGPDGPRRRPFHPGFRHGALKIGASLLVLGLLLLTVHFRNTSKHAAVRRANRHARHARCQSKCKSFFQRLRFWRRNVATAEEGQPMMQQRNVSDSDESDAMSTTMEQEIQQLRAAASMVEDILAAEEGRAREMSMQSSAAVGLNNATNNDISHDSSNSNRGFVTLPPLSSSLSQSPSSIPATEVHMVELPPQPTLGQVLSLSIPQASLGFETGSASLASPTGAFPEYMPVDDSLPAYDYSDSPANSMITDGMMYQPGGSGYSPGTSTRGRGSADEFGDAKPRREQGSE